MRTARKHNYTHPRQYSVSMPVLTPDFDDESESWPMLLPKDEPKDSRWSEE